MERELVYNIIILYVNYSNILSIFKFKLVFVFLVQNLLKINARNGQRTLMAHC